MKQLLRGARTLGPYLLTEALLPGGTLIALGLWLYQNKERLQLFRRKFAVNAEIQQSLAAPARH
jgi:hypothetical protein